jgi:hypothetical protein
MYRRTRKYTATRQAAMQAGRDAARMTGPAPEYPPELPDLRMRITIDRMDSGAERHVIELHRTRRCDVYRATVDGQPWITAGLSQILAGVRKACPRVLSPRVL